MKETERLEYEALYYKTVFKDAKKKKTAFIPPEIPSLYRDYQVQSPDTWLPRIRSRDTVRLTHDFIHYVFFRYPVPSFMVKAWTTVGKMNHDYRWWYVVITSGQSFYKLCAKDVLSRKEAGLFLSAPESLSPDEAIWWARFRAAGELSYAAIEKAKVFNALHVEDDKALLPAVLFFAGKSIKNHELSDILDALSEPLMNGTFSFKGRTLKSLHELSRQWHREQGLIKSYKKCRWDGLPVPNIAFNVGSVHSPGLWVFKQIVSSRELVVEGSNMRHCVGSYVNRCMSGNTFIFSLMYNGKRALTVEIALNGDLVIKQARGFANALPNGKQKNALDACFSVIQNVFLDKNYAMTPPFTVWVENSVTT